MICLFFFYKIVDVFWLYTTVECRINVHGRLFTSYIENDKSITIHYKPSFCISLLNEYVLAWFIVILFLLFYYFICGLKNHFFKYILATSATTFNHHFSEIFNLS